MSNILERLREEFEKAWHELQVVEVPQFEEKEITVWRVVYDAGAYDEFDEEATADHMVSLMEEQGARKVKLTGIDRVPIPPKVTRRMEVSRQDVKLGNYPKNGRLFVEYTEDVKL
jgi:hypothetical protein